MIPIGGREARNTMDEDEALQVVREFNPEIVIPCHYNVAGLFSKKAAPADDIWFKAEVEKLGINCTIMNSGDRIEV
jgi:L-ascorbate metabolism protein UlaG (beta-lactamase superfamily)